LVKEKGWVIGNTDIRLITIDTVIEIIKNIHQEIQGEKEGVIVLEAIIEITGITSQRGISAHLVVDMVKEIIEW